MGLKKETNGTETLDIHQSSESFKKKKNALFFMKTSRGSATRGGHVGTSEGQCVPRTRSLILHFTSRLISISFPLLSL